jgi:hypothetical protein
MKKAIKRKIKYNSKIIKMACLRCNEPFDAYRYDTKFCSDLCRVQESNERKEKGYIKLMFKGSLLELETFLNDFKNPFDNSRFSNDFDDIEDSLNNIGHNKSWKHEFNDFMVYCFPENKKSPFELYYNQEKLNQWKSAKKWGEPIIATLKIKNS